MSTHRAFLRLQAWNGAGEAREKSLEEVLKVRGRENEDQRLDIILSRSKEAITSTTTDQSAG